MWCLISYKGSPYEFDILNFHLMDEKISNRETNTGELKWCPRRQAWEQACSMPGHSWGYLTESGECREGPPCFVLSLHHHCTLCANITRPLSGHRVIPPTSGCSGVYHAVIQNHPSLAMTPLICLKEGDGGIDAWHRQENMKKRSEENQAFESWKLTGRGFKASTSYFTPTFLGPLLCGLTIHSLRKWSLRIEEPRARFSAPLQLWGVFIYGFLVVKRQFTLPLTSLWPIAFNPKRSQYAANLLPLACKGAPSIKSETLRVEYGNSVRVRK